MNLSKSELIPVGNIRNHGQMANILECKVSSIPMKYLGLPLVAASFRAKSIWDEIIEKIACILADWKDCICQKVVGPP